MIIKMDHVGLFVQDIEKAVAFYTDVFGFTLVTQGQNAEKAMAFLTSPGDSNMQLELVQDFNESTVYADVGKVNHLAFTVENIEHSVEQLKEKGLEFLNEPGLNIITGSKSVFFKGPDGELLQLIEPSK